MFKRGIILLIILLVIPICFAKDVNIVETFESEKNTGETTYYYAGSKLIATKNNDVINYEYQDRLGSDVKSKALPFGEEIKSSERFSFTGKELDSELYYFNARYYDSNIGRFTSVDPVEGNNPYAYVENNPMNLVDPSGMAPWGGLEQMAIDRNNPDYVYRNWVEEGPNGYETYGETNAGDTVNLGSAGNAMEVSVFEDPIYMGVTGGVSALTKGFQMWRASRVFNRRLIMGKNLVFHEVDPLDVNSLDDFGRALSLSVAEETSLLEGKVIGRSIVLNSEGADFFFGAQMYIDSEGYHMGLYSLFGAETNSATSLARLNKQIHGVAQTTARNLGFDSYCINYHQVSNQKIAESVLGRGGESVGLTKNLVLLKADPLQGFRAGKNTRYSDIQTRYRIP